MDFPYALALPDPLVHLTTYGPASPLAPTIALGLVPGTMGQNRAHYCPVRVSRPYLVTRLFMLNGATVHGNVDCGIYAEDGTRLVSSGSTAQAGTSAIQSFDVTDTPLGPGLFYLAVASDSATATFYRGTPGTPGGMLLGFAQQATAFPLPAVATMATIISSVWPLLGASSRGFV